MWPLEFVATATDSPSDSPGGSFRKFGTDVNEMSATPVIVAFCCAAAETAVRNSAANVQARYLGIGTSRPPQCSLDCTHRGGNVPTPASAGLASCDDQRHIVALP